MICVFEPVCTKGEHAAFNAALLVSASDISSDGKVAFFGDATHVDRVSECLPEAMATAVNFHKVSVADRQLRVFISRFSIEWPLLSSVWRTVQESRSEMLIITGVTEPGLLAIKLFFLFNTPRIPILVVFHGILPQFLYSLKRRLLLGVFMPKKVIYLVLGRHILQELGTISPWIRRRFRSITHPYIFDEQNISSREISVVPKFAFVGFANRGKGFPEFLRLIENFNENRASANVPLFYLIGDVSNECAKLFEDFKMSDVAWNLWFPSQPGALSMELYRQKISEVDYLVMPHSIDAYKLVVSGSSLDSLMLLKPIIALRSTFFDGFFEKLGDIGYLCNDLDDMSKLVVDLIRSPPHDRYRLQVENLRKGRVLFDPRVTAAEIKSLAF